MAYYKVTGTHEVLGHEPGEVFEAELEGAQHLLVSVGHLSVVEAPAPAVTEEAETPEADAPASAD